MFAVLFTFIFENNLTFDSRVCFRVIIKLVMWFVTTLLLYISACCDICLAQLFVCFLSVLLLVLILLIYVFVCLTYFCSDFPVYLIVFCRHIVHIYMFCFSTGCCRYQFLDLSDFLCIYFPVCCFDRPFNIFTSLFASCFALVQIFLMFVLIFFVLDFSDLQIGHHVLIDLVKSVKNG